MLDVVITQVKMTGQDFVEVTCYVVKPDMSRELFNSDAEFKKAMEVLNNRRSTYLGLHLGEASLEQKVVKDEAT